MIIQPGKQYKTRTALKVIIYTTEAGGTYAVHGAVQKPGSGLEMACWNANGRRVSDEPSSAHPDDIVAEWSDVRGKMIAYVNPVGIVGLFEDTMVPEDIKKTGVRAPWLDEPKGKTHE